MSKGACRNNRRWYHNVHNKFNCKCYQLTAPPPQPAADCRVPNHNEMKTTLGVIPHN